MTLRAAHVASRLTVIPILFFPHKTIIFFMITLLSFAKAQTSLKVMPTKTISASVNIPEKLDFTEGMEILLENVMERFRGCEFVYIEQIADSTLKDKEYSLRNVNLDKVGKDSAGVHQVTVGVNITFPRHEDAHKLATRHCGLGIVIIHEFNNHDESWLVDTVIPRYAPVLRKDVDYFVLITPNQPVSDKVLLSPRFGSRIKYKLAVTHEQSTSQIVCKTVDLYGNGGSPYIIVLKKLNYLAVRNEKELSKFDWFPDMTKSFNGKVFRFAIPKVAFRFEIELRGGKYHPKRGFYKWWLDEAMLKFNFTYDIFWASFGGGTGKRLKNGTWVGATGDIFYGKADCSFIVGEIYSRHKFLGWSSSISYEWVLFVTHLPRKSYSPKAIFWPFTPLMWTLLFATIGVVTFSLKVVASANFNSKGTTKPRSWSSLEIFEFLVSTFLEQDKYVPFNVSSIRVLCAFWLLFAIVAATAYRGKLVSLIAFPVDTWVPTTFEELANSYFKVALNVVGKAGAAYVLIASSTSPIFQKLTARMEVIPDAEVCLKRAMSENLGCIVWKGIADYTSVKNLTDKDGRVPLQESTQIALFIGDGLVYERRAIFGEHLDRTIQAVVQMGLTIKWFQLDEEFIKQERRVYEKSRNITKPVYDYDDGGPKKLVVSQFTGLFLLCVGALLISGGQFVMELIWYRRAMDKQNNSNTPTAKEKESSQSVLTSHVTVSELEQKVKHEVYKMGLIPRTITKFSYSSST